jgi:hypothetical protein
LLADRCLGSGRRDFVVRAAATQIDEIRVVRVLKDSEKIPFAQTFAVSSENLSRRCSNLTCARGTAFIDRTTNEAERILAGEA